jgi:hypothetical protein
MTESEKVKWDIIPPEIKNDMFYQLLFNIVRHEDVKTILEIGASSGDGSTEAFITGKDGKDTKLFSIEVCTERFDVLKERYKHDPNFFPYNVSSVSLDKFPPKMEIVNFLRRNPLSFLAVWPIKTVLEWYDKDVEYVQKNNIPQNGIKKIKQEHGIQRFDFVLIDGSEFLGQVELDEVYGAKFIALDDTRCFKNWMSHRRLYHDPNYLLLMENNMLRNGFSIFKYIGDSL